MSYLLSACNQQGELFYVDRRCIIPRSYIGEILSTASSSEISADNNFPFRLDQVRHALDLCTGSGCLVVLLEKYLPVVEHIDVIDISSDALEVAHINLEKKGLLASAETTGCRSQVTQDRKCKILLLCLRATINLVGCY